MTKGNGSDTAPVEIELMTEDQAMDLMLAIAGHMGWNIMIPEVSDDEEVPGLIMGSIEYIEWIETQLTDKKIPKNLRHKA